MSYSGLEISGNIFVTLSLRGGTSINDISVTVMPSDQSPVSAEGKKSVVYYTYIAIAVSLNLNLITGNGLDYDSTPINATFTAGSTSTTVNVPVIKDDLVEESETFDLTFTIPPSLKNCVIPGNVAKAVGNITDDTGKIIRKALKFTSLCIFLVSMVEFLQSEYYVPENTVALFLLYTKLLSTDFSVELFGVDITASGKHYKSMWYNSVSNTYCDDRWRYRL